ncbi:septation protein IspZ [Congregibacter litoralis]|uniref:Intracellular septation protein A n=1 Tax=Congregibacter litoralis KT71 TaxID=314285 RepID=A4A483_9GAMM|nr:septation protein IspZ [Congregibacter litoralis]EAQ99506.1 Intracellular septation protein A [Congregibacter litoralis KT71]
MSFWTYQRRFTFETHACLVEVSVGMQSMVSRVFVDGELRDRQALYFSAGYRNPVHQVVLSRDGKNTELRIEVGYISWLSVGIEVFADGEPVHKSHPDKNIHFAEESRFLKALPSQDPEVARAAAARWQRNKYSIYADLGLGALFFFVGKFTGDLTLAALIGAGAGLALVAIQRFVRVDLLGGFAVFGTVMLLVSAVFSLAFQSDFMVQMKSTVLGVLTALLFFADGAIRKGQYFGVRMQRYMPETIDTGRMAVGLGMLGLTMAGANYLVATLFSEDAWLNYTTFIDTPLSIGLAYAVYFWARRGTVTVPAEGA